MRALVFAGALAATSSACAPGSIPKMPWERESIVDVAPMAPMLPLAAPRIVMKGGKGPAAATYPAQFTVTVKPDGWITFPDGSLGKIQGASILVNGGPVLTISKSGEVTGNGLKGKYKFAADGDLLDERGHGIRLQPNGGVRGIGGKWKYQDVFTWDTDGDPATKMAWDKSGWRELAAVSLLVIENLLPDAIQ